MMDDEEEKKPAQNFDEMIKLADELNDQLGSVLDQQPMLIATTALLMSVRTGIEAMTEQVAIFLASGKIGHKEDEVMPPSLALETIKAIAKLEEASVDVMNYFAACHLGRDMVEQVKQYFDQEKEKPISDEELTESKSSLDELCNGLFNPSDE